MFEAVKHNLWRGQPLGFAAQNLSDGKMKNEERRVKNQVLHNLTSLSSLFPDKFLSISLTMKWSESFSGNSSRDYKNRRREIGLIFLLHNYQRLLSSLFISLFPQFAHIFQCLALGFRNKFPDEDCCNDTDDAIEAVGEPVTEVIAFCEVHVEHWHEGR